MRMQVCRTKFRKSFILSTKKWIKCFPKFPGKNPVDSREKFGDITVRLHSPRQGSGQASLALPWPKLALKVARLHSEGLY